MRAASVRGAVQGSAPVKVFFIRSLRKRVTGAAQPAGSYTRWTAEARAVLSVTLSASGQSGSRRRRMSRVLSQ